MENERVDGLLYAVSSQFAHHAFQMHTALLRETHWSRVRQHCCTNLFGCTISAGSDDALELGLATASPPPIPSNFDLEECEILSSGDPAWALSHRRPCVSSGELCDSTFASALKKTLTPSSLGIDVRSTPSWNSVLKRERYYCLIWKTYCNK